jgi:deoxyribose-phosphate aldolase
MKAYDREYIAKLIDHTLLKPDATEREIKKLCNEAKKYGFYSVCVHPYFVKTVSDMLSGTDIRITTVVGFPFGMTCSRVKIYEAMESDLCGADELDIVINLGNVKSGRWDDLGREITDIVTATPDAVHKVIIETCYLTDDEKIKSALTVMESGAEFVKTSTGFSSAGADIKYVSLIKAATQGRIGIKAAGGIKTLVDVLSFIEAGATRIGTSSGTNIVNEL